MALTISLIAVHLNVGSGSLSSPMREHRNFAQFYCISVTNSSSLWLYPLGIYMDKKNVFLSLLWLFLCLHCMCLEKSPAEFLREVFAGCLVPITRSETGTKTVDVFIRSATKRYALYTAICGITGSETECWFQWCKHRGLLQTSLVARTLFSQKLDFKPRNALKRLKHLPSKWSWIRTLSNEVWG